MGNIPEFFTALLTLISSFTGQPETLPPLQAVEFQNRGVEVSEVARTFRMSRQSGPTGATGTANQNGPIGPTGDTGPAGETGHSGSSGNTGHSGPAGTTGQQGPTGATGVGRLRIPAVNIRSGMTMPHDLPQIAVDMSEALDVLDSEDSLPLPPGHRETGEEGMGNFGSNGAFSQNAFQNRSGR